MNVSAVLASAASAPRHSGSNKRIWLRSKLYLLSEFLRFPKGKNTFVSRSDNSSNTVKQMRVATLPSMVSNGPLGGGGGGSIAPSRVPDPCNGVKSTPPPVQSPAGQINPSPLQPVQQNSAAISSSERICGLKSCNPAAPITSLSATTSTATSSSPPATTNLNGSTTRTIPAKRSSKDYIFGKVIGEGSFSTVYITKDIHTSKEYAIKVCDKRHIIREKKTEYVKRERDVLNLLSNAGVPFFVKLFCTFQDPDRLYFVLSYAKNGELLHYINRAGAFNVDCTRFYAGEILLALEHLHRLNIIHRDLKPENILLDENMHILITDFGTSKMVGQPESEDQEQARRNSFVGTAQYVSPEHLTEKCSSPASDLWALGCIVYQMVSGLPPFRSKSEYMVFQKILKLEYDFPDGFNPVAEDFVQKLLVIEPNDRLGGKDVNGYRSIRSHQLFDGVDWNALPSTNPPQILPYMPNGHESHSAASTHSNYRIPDHLEPGLDDKQLTRLLGLDLGGVGVITSDQSIISMSAVSYSGSRRGESSRNIADIPADQMAARLANQIANNHKWHTLVEGNLILKQGLVDKRKGLFARRRMLLLTLGPHLYYVDPATMVLKGEIPWSADLRTETKNFKIFFVHTPNRTYYLEDPEGYAMEWCRRIDEVRLHVYGS